MEQWLKITGTMAHELPERRLYFTVICKEAEKKLKDAVLLYLNTIKELGTRKEIFKKKNIKIYSYKPKPMLEKNKMPKSFNNFPFITQQAISLNL